ncbi:unnamed protein product [Parajaminaea phylloscopi]
MAAANPASEAEPFSDLVTGGLVDFGRRTRGSDLAPAWDGPALDMSAAPHQGIYSPKNDLAMSDASARRLPARNARPSALLQGLSLGDQSSREMEAIAAAIADPGGMVDLLNAGQDRLSALLVRRADVDEPKDGSPEVDYAASIKLSTQRLTALLRASRGSGTAQNMANGWSGRSQLSGGSLLARLEQVAVMSSHSGGSKSWQEDCLCEGVKFLLVLVEAQCAAFSAVRTNEALIRSARQQDIADEVVAAPSKPHAGAGTKTKLLRALSRSSSSTKDANSMGPSSSGQVTLQPSSMPLQGNSNLAQASRDHTTTLQATVKPKLDTVQQGLADERRRIQLEVEDLTTSVFAEANAMVRAERQKSAELRAQLDAIQSLEALPRPSTRPAKIDVEPPHPSSPRRLEGQPHRTRPERATQKHSATTAGPLRPSSGQDTTPVPGADPSSTPTSFLDVSRSLESRVATGTSSLHFPSFIDMGTMKERTPTGMPSSWSSRRPGTSGSSANDAASFHSVGEQDSDIDPLPHNAETAFRPRPWSVGPQVVDDVVGYDAARLEAPESDSSEDEFAETLDHIEGWPEPRNDLPRNAMLGHSPRSAAVVAAEEARQFQLQRASSARNPERPRSRTGSRQRASLPPRAPQPSSPLPDRPDGSPSPASPLGGPWVTRPRRNTLLRGSVGSASDHMSSTSHGGLSQPAVRSSASNTKATDVEPQLRGGILSQLIPESHDEQHRPNLARNDKNQLASPLVGLGVETDIAGAAVGSRPLDDKAVLEVDHDEIPKKSMDIAKSESCSSNRDASDLMVASTPGSSYKQLRGIGRHDSLLSSIATTLSCDQSSEAAANEEIRTDPAVPHIGHNGQSIPETSQAPLVRSASRASGTSQASSSARSTARGPVMDPLTTRTVNLASLGVTSPPVLAASKYKRGSRSRILGHSNTAAGSAVEGSSSLKLDPSRNLPRSMLVGRTATMRRKASESDLPSSQRSSRATMISEEAGSDDEIGEWASGRVNGGYDRMHRGRHAVGDETHGDSTQAGFAAAKNGADTLRRPLPTSTTGVFAAADQPLHSRKSASEQHRSEGRDRSSGRKLRFNSINSSMSAMQALS